MNSLIVEFSLVAKQPKQATWVDRAGIHNPLHCALVAVAESQNSTLFVA